MFGLALTIPQIISFVLANQSTITAVASAAIKYGPQVAEAYKNRKEIIGAVDGVVPGLSTSLKSLAGGLLNAAGLTAESSKVDAIAGQIAGHAFVPGWTDEETQAWWDRAQGQA
jgi:hypothetical protein